MSPEDRHENLMIALAEHVAALPDEELLEDARAAGIDVGAAAERLRNMMLAAARRGRRAVVLSTEDVRLITDALRSEARAIRTAHVATMSGGALKLDQDAARRLADAVALRAHEQDRLADELANVTVVLLPAPSYPVGT